MKKLFILSLLATSFVLSLNDNARAQQGPTVSPETLAQRQILNQERACHGLSKNAQCHYSVFGTTGTIAQGFCHDRGQYQDMICMPTRQP